MRRVFASLSAAFVLAGWLVVGPAVTASAVVPHAVPGDLTGDGTPDAYVFTEVAQDPNWPSCTVTITPGDTTGSYAGRQFVLDLPAVGYGCPDLMASGDTAGDGKIRVAMSWFFCGPDKLLLLAAENDSFVIHEYPTIFCASLVQTADLNGDGRADFVEWSDNPGGLWTYLGQPDGTVSPDLTGAPLASGVGIFATAGLMAPNNDGRTELLLTESDGSGYPTDLEVYAYEHPMFHIVGPSTLTGALYQGDFVGASFADVNGDGWQDVNVDTGGSTFTAFQRPDHTFYLGVRASVSTVVAGQHSRVVAYVAQTSSSGRQPTGTVTFVIDGNARAPIRVSASKASTPLPAMNAGIHTLLALYSGDARHPASSSPPVLFTVSQASTSMKLATADRANHRTRAWTNTVVVSAVKPGSGTPTGTVTFTLDGVSQPPVTLVCGKAKFSFVGLTVGTHALTATYSGDANFRPSTLATVHHKVT